MQSQYWTDEAYAEFYKMSGEEQRIVNGKVQSGMRDTQKAKLPQFGKEPSNEPLRNFQRVFAEFSGGREWVRAVDVRRLFADSGVTLSPAQVREMLKEIAPDEASPKPHYSELLHMYCNCMGFAMGTLEKVNVSKSPPANDAVDESDVLLVDEAREYCVVAGVPDAELEDLLRAHTSDGLVSLIGLDKDLKKLDAAGCLTAPCLNTFAPGVELGQEISPGATTMAGDNNHQMNVTKASAVPKLDILGVPSQDTASSAIALDLEAAVSRACEESAEPAFAVTSQAAEVQQEDDLASLKKQLEEAKAALVAKKELHRHEIDRYKAELHKMRMSASEAQ